MKYLRSTMRLIVAVIIAGPLFVDAAIGGELEPGPDPCATELADLFMTVPLVFSTALIIPSGSGWYAYGERPCPYYMVDLQVMPYSHSFKIGDEWKAEPFSVDAGPYDLPSSVSFGGMKPTVQEDCNRWIVAKKIYVRLQNDRWYTWKRTEKLVGNWVSGDCQLVLVNGYGYFSGEIKQPISGSDIYRIAIRTKLRSTYQEVAVTFGELPPG